MTSVIIPCYNSEKYLPILLDALAKQEGVLDDAEYIFVDNGSTDGSLSILRSQTSKLQNSRVLVYTSMQSSYAARNHGATHATGDAFAFTDADCVPEPDWLAQANKIAQAHDGPFLSTGMVELFPKSKRYNPYEWYDKSTAMRQEHYSATQTGATANLLVSRSAFDMVGGFRPIESGGDRDFCTRVMQTGCVAYSYHETLKVRHPARGSKAEIRKKARRINRGLASLHVLGQPQARRWAYVVKQVLALVLMPNQWRIALSTFASKQPHPSPWVFLLVALREGAFARYNLIRASLRAMKTSANHDCSQNR